MSNQEKVRELKRQILSIAHFSGEGHVASSFSVLDILWVLYNQVMKIDPHNVSSPDRDYFILSKGHASLALYAVLAEAGFIELAELRNFSMHGSHLGGHPCYKLVRGVEASTGSLGHGLPIAVGIAMSLAYEKRDNHVFCVIGDGEMNEGSIWESMLLAGHHNLKNLTVILDYNQSNERALRLPVYGLRGSSMIVSMGWDYTLINGHDHKALVNNLKPSQRVLDDLRPHFILADTKKGNGLAEMENNPHAWHHRAPNAEELPIFLEKVQ